MGRWEQVCHAAQAMVSDAMWAPTAARDFGWCVPVKPHFLTHKAFYLRMRQGTWPTARPPPATHRPGRLYVVGGSCERPAPVDTCDVFADVGGARVHPGGWACPLEKHTLAPLQTKRSAPGVARDHNDVLWAVGGWSGTRALASVETLGVEASTAPAPAPGGYRRKDTWVTEGRPLSTGRCFLASIVDLHGRLHALGGGESIWQGARVFKSTEVLATPSEASCAWEAGPALQEARCGLAAALSAAGHIHVAGGYGGGTRYSASVEVLLAGDPEGASRGWLPNVVPPMHVARTGFGLAFGPQGSLYSVGGSPDGLHSHRSLERCDPREGPWHFLPAMTTPRGYCSATFGASGLLYVCGGQSHDDEALTSTVEVYEPRANKWRVLPGSLGANEGVARVDLALVYALT